MYMYMYVYINSTLVKAKQGHSIGYFVVSASDTQSWPWVDIHMYEVIQGGGWH